ncbi:MAG TPA: RsmE family RNA methyltransferase [Balneolaceae bacterium]|nr:RsmE family RNA methyltransferase [Balneolaceae bacterium]
MDNIFYAPPVQIGDNVIELRDQEAIHASRALRYGVGDDIVVVDGRGGWYEGEVQSVADKSVRIIIQNYVPDKNSQPNVILGMGIIKKRDRLEFAVEKAVELGVKKIAFFRSEYTVKQNIRLDRLNAIALSAMKQSLQAWRPELQAFKNLEQLAKHYRERDILVAHQSADASVNEQTSDHSNSIILIGPEGGFSPSEIDHIIKQRDGKMVSLGPNRLRAETAVVTALSHYHL